MKEREKEKEVFDEEDAVSVQACSVVLLKRLAKLTHGARNNSQGEEERGAELPSEGSAGGGRISRGTSCQLVISPPPLLSQLTPSVRFVSFRL